MRINAKGRALIEQFEGCRLTSYRDVAGILTVGYGHTGSDVKEGMTISQSDAVHLLDRDLSRFEYGVTAMIGAAPTTSDQFSAMVSFAFNLGLQSLLKSTLLKKHKAGDIKGASEQFASWNKARVNGQLVPLAGLTARRAAEAALYKGATS